MYNIINFIFKKIIYSLKPLLLGFFLLFINITFPQLGLYGALQIASNKVIALQDQPLYFFNGVIGSEGEDAQLLFLGSAQALNASEDAYSEIEVSITAQENFIFPLGNQGRYLPLQLREGNATALQAQLKIGSPLNQSLATGIDQLIPSHHWQLSGDKIAKIQLSWDQNAQLDAFLLSDFIGIRKVVIKKFNTLYYRQKEDRIEIISFFSNRQNPGNLKNVLENSP